MIVVEKMIYGGIDWHDSSTKKNFLYSKPSNFSFSSKEVAKQAIIEDMVSEFPYIEKEIRNAFETGERIEIPTKVNIYDNDGNKIGFDYGETIDDNGGKTYYESSIVLEPEKLEYCHYYSFGQLEYIISYFITEIEKPIYVVIENFLAVAKGVPSTDRIYTKPFSNYTEAEAYMSNFKAHEGYRTQVYIACFDLDNINQDWYKDQLDVIELLESNKELSLYDDTFSPYAEEHYENLMKKIGENV